ncbi:unnamed protein product, partial [Mesorhabditis belari]|uniref:Uncharacterized protein n=1 Tax=Mesorhabditis belari TaxID=2138241 RepID=A0AAF3F1N4_9BILA
MPGHPSLAIRRALLELVDDENLLEKLDSYSDEVTNHPHRRLKVLALQQLAELRLELKQELVDYGRMGKIGKLMGLLDRETLGELGEGSFKESSTNRSSASSSVSDETPSTSSTTPQGSELPQPMIPSFIPALNVGSPLAEAQEKRQEIGTVKEFRNVIEVVKIPDLPKKLKDRTFNATRKLRGESDDETSDVSDETTVESHCSKGHKEIRGFLKGLRRREMEKIHPETSNSQNLQLIPSKPIERLKRDEAIQCPSHRKEKKDAITSPIEQSDPLGSALSDYTKAFDEDFSSSQPSSDPSIGQIRLEPEELSTRKIISIRPDGSFVRRKPKVYEPEEDSPQSTSTSTQENSSESREEEVVSCMASNWRAGSRVLRLDFADLSSSAIETVSARGNESVRHSLSIDLHSISQSENLSETQPSS